MEGKGRYIILGAVAIVVAMATFFIGRNLGQREGVIQAQVEAVKQGHGKYIIFDEFGRTEFHWLDHGDVEPKVAPAAQRPMDFKNP